MLKEIRAQEKKFIFYFKGKKREKEEEEEKWTIRINEEK